MRPGGKHILSTSPPLSTGVRVARCDAVLRLLVAKSDGLLVHREHRRNIRPFDRVVGASRLTHEHLMRANEALTSPMAWFLAGHLDRIARSRAAWKRAGSRWQKSKGAVVCRSAGSPLPGGARRAWTTGWPTSSGQSRRNSSWPITHLSGR